jgi:hypothetical protein
MRILRSSRVMHRWGSEAPVLANAGAPGRNARVPSGRAATAWRYAPLACVERHAQKKPHSTQLLPNRDWLGPLSQVEDVHHGFEQAFVLRLGAHRRNQQIGPDLAQLRLEQVSPVRRTEQPMRLATLHGRVLSEIGRGQLQVHTFGHFGLLRVPGVLLKRRTRLRRVKGQPQQMAGGSEVLTPWLPRCRGAGHQLSCAEPARGHAVLVLGVIGSEVGLPGCRPISL